MPRKSSTEKIEAEFQAGTVKVVRRSLAHEHDIIVSTKEIAKLINIGAPACSELILAAGVECVGQKVNTKLYWMGESLSRIAQHYAPAKLRKGEKKKKHSEIENEKVTAIEARRIRKLDIEIAKSENEWIPFDLANYALSRFLQEARSVFTSCVPLLKQKHGNEIPIAIYDSLNQHLSQTYNMTCDLKLDTGTGQIFEPEDD